MEKELLEVGDVVYTNNRWHGLIKHVIERVTNKQSFSGHLKINIQLISDGEGKRSKILGESYSSVYLETDKLLKKYTEQQLRAKLRSKVSKLQYETIDIEKVKNLLEVLEDGK